MNKAIREQLIDFETAKLAKEKGFDIPVSFCYNRNGEIGEPIPLTDFNAFTIQGSMTMYSAPTQSLLQKWLREKYNIHINIECYAEMNDYNLIWYPTLMNLLKMDEIKMGISHKTFCLALEEGLIEALKLIK